MKTIKELSKSPHIQISIATGISILVIAYFSKYVLPKPIGYLPTAIPPFFMVIYEAVATKYKDHKITRTWYWVTAIFISTALVIMLHMI
jgi:predicted histidine transporter YuiF (NhaC family)